MRVQHRARGEPAARRDRDGDLVEAVPVVRVQVEEPLLPHDEHLGRGAGQRAVEAWRRVSDHLQPHALHLGRRLHVHDARGAPAFQKEVVVHRVEADDRVSDVGRARRPRHPHLPPRRRGAVQGLEPRVHRREPRVPRDRPDGEANVRVPPVLDRARDLPVLPQEAERDVEPRVGAQLLRVHEGVGRRAGPVAAELGHVRVRRRRDGAVHLEGRHELVPPLRARVLARHDPVGFAQSAVRLAEGRVDNLDHEIRGDPRRHVVERDQHRDLVEPRVGQRLEGHHPGLRVDRVQVPRLEEHDAAGVRAHVHRAHCARRPHARRPHGEDRRDRRELAPQRLGEAARRLRRRVPPVHVVVRHQHAHHLGVGGCDRPPVRGVAVRRRV
mmetsp:Transcript_15485/g.37429  ORF Transcript_15485/g.37429 Transcript_15485/m.37429 type:complete len:383 (-) Transcript_15485:1844-2992(-)